jgi:protein Cut8
MSCHICGTGGIFIHSFPRANSLFAVSPYQNMNRKRKADEDGDEMSVSPLSSPAVSTRQIARPTKKVRANEVVGRPLTFPRLLETLDATQLRTVLERICERHPDIGQEVVAQAPRPSVASALQVLQEYQDRFKASFPYGEGSAEYTYFRVKAPLVALIEALSDFTPQYLPPNENQPAISLQYLDGATKVIHGLPNWEPQSYRHHKENAYDEISRAWALVINEAAKRGAGFPLHTGGWDQTLAKHNEQSGGRLATAMEAMAANVGWMGNNANASSSSDPDSIFNQLMSGTYGTPVKVGPW